MKDKTKKVIKEIIVYAIIIILVILLRTFVVTPVRVNGNSMDPTLNSGDIMLLNKISKNDIKRFDIVVVKMNDEYLIKRVIGLPGEIIEYKDDTLYIDGAIIDEDFTHTDTKDFNLKSFPYVAIPDECYFLIGDNRIDSLDSRIFGAVSKDDILGHADFVIFPFSRFGNRK